MHPTNTQRAIARPDPGRRTVGEPLTSTSVETRQSTRHQLAEVTHLLIAEFAGTVAPGMIIRHVGQAREQLLGAGVRAGLAPATEAMVRLRLRELTPPPGAA